MRWGTRATVQRSAATEALRCWTRARFALEPEAVVSVAEIACSQPGCPPLETVVTFWSDEQTRHHFKIFKPLDAVREDDLPPRWMKPALISSGEGDELCC